MQAVAWRGGVGGGAKEAVAPGATFLAGDTFKLERHFGFPV